MVPRGFGGIEFRIAPYRGEYRCANTVLVSYIERPNGACVRIIMALMLREYLVLSLQIGYKRSKDAFAGEGETHEQTEE